MKPIEAAMLALFLGEDESSPSGGWVGWVGRGPQGRDGTGEVWEMGSWVCLGGSSSSGPLPGWCSSVIRCTDDLSPQLNDFRVLVVEPRRVASC